MTPAALSPAPRYLCAFALAVVANAVVVVGLAHLSHLRTSPAPLAISAHVLRQVPQEPPAPPTAPLEPVPLPEPAAPAQQALTLPSLELPALPSPAALPLPALGSPSIGSELQIAMPDFRVAEGTSPENAGPPVALPTVDIPAEREGTFDLERFYPREARVHKITGRSRVRIWITATGEVSQVAVTSSTPPAVFDQAAARLAHSLHFRPAMSANNPVPSIQDTIISWTIK